MPFPWCLHRRRTPAASNGQIELDAALCRLMQRVSMEEEGLVENEAQELVVRRASVSGSVGRRAVDLEEAEADVMSLLHPHIFSSNSDLAARDAMLASRCGALLCFLEPRHLDITEGHLDAHFMKAAITELLRMQDATVPGIMLRHAYCCCTLLSVMLQRHRSSPPAQDQSGLPRATAQGASCATWTYPPASTIMGASQEPHDTFATVGAAPLLNGVPSPSCVAQVDAAHSICSGTSDHNRQLDALGEHGSAASGTDCEAQQPLLQTAPDRGIDSGSTHPVSWECDDAESVRAPRTPPPAQRQHAPAITPELLHVPAQHWHFAATAVAETEQRQLLQLPHCTNAPYYCVQEQQQVQSVDASRGSGCAAHTSTTCDEQHDKTPAAVMINDTHAGCVDEMTSDLHHSKDEPCALSLPCTPAASGSALDDAITLTLMPGTPDRQPTAQPGNNLQEHLLRHLPHLLKQFSLSKPDASIAADPAGRGSSGDSVQALCQPPFASKQHSMDWCAQLASTHEQLGLLLRPPGADELLPLVVWTVVQAQPTSLVRCINYVRRFRARALWQGEEDYCMTLLASATQFINTLSLRQLTLTPTEAERFLQASLA